MTDAPPLQLRVVARSDQPAIAPAGSLGTKHSGYESFRGPCSLNRSITVSEFAERARAARSAFQYFPERSIMYSLIYVSRSQLLPGEAGKEIESIVKVSATRNAAAGVTGALLYTGKRFAQWLEGEELAVLDIMASIARDPRHCEIVTIDQGPAAARRFSSWSLAYLGHSTFADATVARALAEHGQADGYARRNLIRLLQELARSPVVRPEV